MPNRVAWVGNVNGAVGPYIMKGLFQAGDSQAVLRGEILQLSGSNWVPMSADGAMNSDVAVANEEIKAGDRAGYYEIVVPRPGDIFDFELSAASAIAVAAALYWSTSQVLAASGSNVLGRAVGQEHYPQFQGHLSDDASGDAGTTIRNTSYVRMVFLESVSYYSAFQTG